MRKQKGRWFRVSLLALAALLVVPSSVLAIENGGVGGRPAHPDANNPRSASIFVYALGLGETKTDGLFVTNSTGETKTLEVYPVDGIAASGGALSCEQQVESKDEVGSWIKLERTEVAVPPGGAIEVPFTVEVPTEKVSPGEHNGCIAVQTKGQSPERSEGGIAISTRAALRVAVTIPGDVKSELSLENYKVTRSKNGNYATQTLLKNTGNVSTDADIKTETKFLFWPVVDRNGGQFNVLPFVTGEFNFDLKRPFWGLLYSSRATATYDADPGPGTDTKTLKSAKKWFWVWPQPLAAAIELGVLLLLVLYARMMRRRGTLRRSAAIWVAYKVRKGDTLKSIAKERRTSVWALAKVNQVTKKYEPKAGESLKVPPAEGEPVRERPAPAAPRSTARKASTKKTPARKAAAKKPAVKRTTAKKTVAKKRPTTKKAAAKKPAVKAASKAPRKPTTKKPAAKKRSPKR